MHACVYICEMSSLYLQGSITMTEFLYQNLNARSKRDMLADVIVGVSK